jgi:hypothetical protein
VVGRAHVRADHHVEPSDECDDCQEAICDETTPSLELLHLIASIRESLRRSKDEVRVVGDGRDRAAYALDQTAEEAANDSPDRLLKPGAGVADPQKALASLTTSASRLCENGRSL